MIRFLFEILSTVLIILPTQELKQTVNLKILKLKNKLEGTGKLRHLNASSINNKLTYWFNDVAAT